MHVKAYYSTFIGLRSPELNCRRTRWQLTILLWYSVQPSCASPLKIFPSWKTFQFRRTLLSTLSINMTSFSCRDLPNLAFCFYLRDNYSVSWCYFVIFIYPVHAFHCHVWWICMYDVVMLCKCCVCFAWACMHLCCYTGIMAVCSLYGITSWKYFPPAWDVHTSPEFVSGWWLLAAIETQFHTQDCPTPAWPKPHTSSAGHVLRSVYYYS